VRIFLTLVLLFSCTAIACGARDPRTLTLVDQRGAPFTLADLRGRPAIVTFVATRCVDACPMANAEFLGLEKQLRADGTRATLVTVTLDPAYDTPFVMSRLAHDLDADPRDWRVASGAREDVESLMRSFGIVVRTNKDGIPDEHSNFVYVLDRNGRLARTLLLSTNLVEETARLLRSGKIARRQVDASSSLRNSGVEVPRVARPDALTNSRLRARVAAQ
jgi:protein SCO1/2